jgi:predicted ATPase
MFVSTSYSANLTGDVLRQDWGSLPGVRRFRGMLHQVSHYELPQSRAILVEIEQATISSLHPLAARLQ